VFFGQKWFSVNLNDIWLRIFFVSVNLSQIWLRFIQIFSILIQIDWDLSQIFIFFTFSQSNWMTFIFLIIIFYGFLVIFVISKWLLYENCTFRGWIWLKSGVENEKYTTFSHLRWTFSFKHFKKISFFI
jgi:hypothetical protein